MSVTKLDLIEIYVNAPVAKDHFEIISLNAPWFSQKFYLQYAFTEGVSVTLETDEEVFAEYAPMSIGRSGNNGDMSYEREIIIQQVNDLIAYELDNRDYDSQENVVIEFRTFIMFRDETVEMVPNSLITTRVNRTTRTGISTSVNTSSKPINNKRTGEVVTITRNPMLKGFL